MANGGEPAAAAHGLPADDELMSVLQQSVDELFSTMIAAFEKTAIVKPAGGSAEVHGLAHLCIDLSAIVAFAGHMNGSVVLRCSADGAHDLARGLLMLGEGECLDVSEVKDALGECANMITGSMKTKVLDPRGSFQLGLPQITEGAGAGTGRLTGSLVYKLSKGPIALEIWRAD